MMHLKYCAFVEIVVKELQKALPIKQSPNVYEWESVKRFFSEFWEFQFDVKLNKDQLKKGNLILYNITETEGRKIMQFQIPEPSDEITCYYSQEAFNYIEVLRIIFFEYFSIQKSRFSMPENNYYNKRFVAQMLVPDMSFKIAYSALEEDLYHKKIIEKEKFINLFRTDWDVIEEKFRIMKEKKCI